MSGSRIVTDAREVFIGIGTNLGDRRANLAAAVAHLGQLLDIQAISSIYETDPVGFTDQERFWNMVAQARTRLEPAELLQQLIELEQAMGRERTFRNAPRIIDLDILLYDDVITCTPGLTLPHPRMTERAFVLKPLVELAPHRAHPVTGVRFSETLQQGGFERAIVVSPPLVTT